MKREVKKLENSHVEVLVTVDKKTWEDAQAKAFKKEASEVTIPGFRKGKAPDNMVKNKVNQAKVMDRAINDLLPSLYDEVLKEEHIEPFMRPDVNVTKISEDGIEVKFSIVTFPEITLGAYKDLAIGKEEVKVTAKEVNEKIDELLKNNASLVVKEDAAEKGDTVVMDFVGTIDDVAFEGGSSENYELELGSNSFIPGFEDQLVGVKAGEEKDVNVTFPENYTEELKGKAAKFACKVHEVKAKKLPELNDEFVKEQNIKDVNTVEEFKAFKKTELLNNKKAVARNEYLGKVLDKIAEGATISIPQEAIDTQAAQRKQDVVQQMKQSGLTYEQYLGFVGQTDEKFMETLKDQSAKSIRNYLIIDAVAKAEKIDITDKDLEEEFKKLSEQYHMPLENVKKALEAQLDQFKDNLRGQKAEDILFDSNN